MKNNTDISQGEVLIRCDNDVGHAITSYNEIRNTHTPKEETHTRPRLCHFGLYVVRATLFCLKVSSRWPGWSVYMGEISVAKIEISVTGPERPLIWTHRYFCKEKSDEARSRKPSQPRWPGSYEEVLAFRRPCTCRCSLSFLKRKRSDILPFAFAVNCCRSEWAWSERARQLSNLQKITL